MTPDRLRPALRFVHIGGAVLVITYVYKTPPAHAPLTIVARIAVPVVALCGLLMWKLSDLRRTLVRKR